MTDRELIAQTTKIGDRLVEDFPQDPQAVTLAGHIWWALDEPSRAVAAWKKCTQLSPDHAPAWTSLGMEAFRNGDFDQAVQCYEHAYRLSPAMSEWDLSMMTQALLNTGKPERVVAIWEPLRSARPALAGVRVTLGHAYLQLNQYQKAKQELLAAVAIDPRSARAHFALAQALARLGDEASARQHREEYSRLKAVEMTSAGRKYFARLKADMVELRPTAARLLAWTGEVYALHGRADEAQGFWAASLSVDPNCAQARRHLGMPPAAQGPAREAGETATQGGPAQAPVDTK
jgi:tetratricopeptide (TPR) repeat protein